jgi:hypothetical protein
MKATLKPLLAERDRLIDQVSRLYEQAEAARNKLEGLELAISLLGKGQAEEPRPETKPASNIKVLLHELAREAKGDGLNANIAVQMAAKRGIVLKRGTAASNLSRLKTDGALIYDGNRYRLPEFARQKSYGVGNISPAGNVVGLADQRQVPPMGNLEQVGGVWRPKGS